MKLDRKIADYIAPWSIMATCAVVLGSSLIICPPAGFAGEVQESLHNEIGYPTVAQALAALRSKPGVQILQQGGWTIISEPASSTLWSFAPAEHPAYPSAVKRSLSTRGGATYIDMKVLCEASKVACDQLVVDFQQLNQKMIESVRGPPPAATGKSPDAMARPGDSGGPRRGINVTSDSAPGWLPSAEQQSQVRQVALEFLAALDGGYYQRAYSLMSDIQRAQEAFDRFATRLKGFNSVAGPVIERRIIQVTWTKDPANAPAPGVYAAVDLASRFKNIDRHCGYIMLYQAKADQPFLVMRQEDTFMTNDSARQIAKEQSPESPDETWARVSKICPNYVATSVGKFE